MRRSNFTWACLATLATGAMAIVPLAGCGRNTGLTLKILTPPDSDPFASANTVVLTLQGDQTSQQQTTATVTSGRFEAKLELSDPMRDSYVWVKVEALDGGGQVVGRGRSPLFVLPQSDTDVTVYVGRPGQVTTTAVKLPDDSGSQATPVGRKLLAGASLRGRRNTPSNEPSLGALIVGGLNESAQPMAKAWRYSPILHNLVDSGSSQVARHGAVLVPSADAVTGHQALMWGGADAAGTLLTPADKFDPQVSDISLLWTAPAEGMADAGPPGAYAPAVTEIKDAEFLITGGANQVAAAGALPLAQAVLISRTPNPTTEMPAKLGVTRLSPTGGMGPMAAARLGHSASAVTIDQGIGAFLFGGLSYADRGTAPVAEFFLESAKTFTAVTLGATPPESRRGHAAVTLKSNKVLIVGGYTEDGSGKKTVLDSALIIDPRAQTFVEKPGFLRTPRYAASITMLSTEILICGGFDGSGSDGSGIPQNTCEEFTADEKLDRLGELYTMPRARAGHLALPLETDQVVLVGGIGDGMRPIADIDLYTAR